MALGFSRCRPFTWTGFGLTTQSKTHSDRPNMVHLQPSLAFSKGTVKVQVVVSVVMALTLFPVKRSLISGVTTSWHRPNTEFLPTHCDTHSAKNYLHSPQWLPPRSDVTGQDVPSSKVLPIVLLGLFKTTTACFVTHLPPHHCISLYCFLQHNLPNQMYIETLVKMCLFKTELKLNIVGSKYIYSDFKYSCLALTETGTRR